MPRNPNFTDDTLTNPALIELEPTLNFTSQEGADSFNEYADASAISRQQQEQGAVFAGGPLSQASSEQWGPPRPPDGPRYKLRVDPTYQNAIKGLERAGVEGSLTNSGEIRGRLNNMELQKRLAPEAADPYRAMQSKLFDQLQQSRGEKTDAEFEGERASSQMFQQAAQQGGKVSGNAGGEAARVSAEGAQATFVERDKQLSSSASALGAGDAQRYESEQEAKAQFAALNQVNQQFIASQRVVLERANRQAYESRNQLVREIILRDRKRQSVLINQSVGVAAGVAGAAS